MKKIAYLSCVSLLLAFTACKKDEAAENFWTKTLAGQEVVAITEADYPVELQTPVQGEVTLSVDWSAFGSDERFTCDASIKTNKATKVTVDGKEYTLKGPNGDYYTYSTMVDETANPEYLKTRFGKNIEIKIEIQSQSAITETIYSPKKIGITQPIPNPSTPSSFEVTSTTDIKWNVDAGNTNGIIVNIHEITVPDNAGNMPTGNDYLLLTPDDGTLSVGDLVPYIPQNGNHFQIILNRLSYELVTSGTKKYRLVSVASVSSTYLYVP